MKRHSSSLAFTVTVICAVLITGSCFYALRVKYKHSKHSNTEPSSSFHARTASENKSSDSSSSIIYEYVPRDPKHNKWNACDNSSEQMIINRRNKSAWTSMIAALSALTSEPRSDAVVCGSDVHSSACVCMSELYHGFIISEAKIETMSEEVFVATGQTSRYCKERLGFDSVYPTWLAVTFYEESIGTHDITRKELIVSERNKIIFFFDAVEKSEGFVKCHRQWAKGESYESYEDSGWELPSRPL